MTVLPRFTLGAIRRGPKTYAKLKAIEQLIGCEVADDPADWVSTTLRKCLYALVYSRRTRVTELLQAGWKKYGMDLTRVYACPPDCVFNTPAARECRLDYFCPFCWLRHVLGPAYDRVAWALFNTTRLSANPPPFRRLDLALLTKHSYIDWQDCGNPHDIYVDVRRRMKELCGEDLAGLALGSYSLAALEPATFGIDQLVLHERVMTLVRPGSNLQPIAVKHKMQLDTLLAAKLNAYNMAKLIAGCCNYPTGLLKGSPETSLKAMQLRARKRKGGQRIPSATESWGYLKQYHTHKFDLACQRAFLEQQKDETYSVTRTLTGAVPARAGTAN